MVLSSSIIFFLICQLFALHLVDCHCPKEFICGTLTLRFPFTKRSEPNCGLILVECVLGSHPIIQIQPAGDWSILFQTNNGIVSWIIPPFLGKKDCNVFNNITLPKNNHAISFSKYLPNVSLLKCKTNSSSQNSNALAVYRNFTQCEKEHGFNIYYNHSDGVISDHVGNDYPSSCSIIQWPVANRTFDPQNGVQMFHLLDTGIRFNWTLYGSCKECYLSKQGCRVDTENYICTKEEGNKHLYILLPATLSFGGIVLLAIMACCLRRHYLMNHSIYWGTKRLDHKNIEEFLKNYKPLGPKRYSYNDIKRMTNSFKNNIGQGGFGSVFKGCFIDGTQIAVKILNDSKGNGEEFINEVASIGRTSHVNIVKLLGFCFEGNKRGLVYEFMPKGSLEKFIFDGDNQLGMQELFKIALGVARGLEYLHRLCATRIVHFDVKPHNVLLDEDFTPKISDFGLAKSSPQEYRSSIISLSLAQGTIGYIAPEVMCRYLGSVSHKSDVYSYGMMVLEIVGGRRNVDNGVDNSSQIYMPHWIYNQIETNHDANFISTGNDEDDEAARKMIIVSFWCIQTDPSSRLTMTRVVEMLDSRVESLQIPPKPYLFSSPNSSVDPSTRQNE